MIDDLYIPRAYGQSSGFTYNEQKRQIDLEKIGLSWKDKDDREGWKNTGGLSWKDKEDRKVTWMNKEDT